MCFACVCKLNTAEHHGHDHLLKGWVDGDGAVGLSFGSLHSGQSMVHKKHCAMHWLTTIGNMLGQCTSVIRHPPPPCRMLGDKEGLGGLLWAVPVVRVWEELLAEFDRLDRSLNELQSHPVKIS